jgi:hypothetical protein
VNEREEMFLFKAACLRHVDHRRQQRRWLLLKRKKSMTNLKLLSAAAIAAAMLTTPVLAKPHHAHHVRHVAEAAVPAGAHYINGRLCVPAPRVDAYATAPWENETPCEP